MNTKRARVRILANLYSGAQISRLELWEKMKLKISNSLEIAKREQHEYKASMCKKIGRSMQLCTDQ